MLLDPKLTEKAIKEKIIIDFAIKENKEKIPSIFIFKKIDEYKCLIDGTFIIEGSLSQNINIETKFSIPLSYPEDSSIICHFDKKEQNQILCVFDKDINNQKIISEQIIIKERYEEIMILKSVTSEKLTCLNGVLVQSQKKIESPITFRQVSHLEPNGINGFSFLFVPLFTQIIKQEVLIIKIIVIIDGKNILKDSNCSLVAHNFKCELTMEKEEYSKIDFKNTESIKMYTENEEITGISELEVDQICPLATDRAINETKKINENKNELEECIDFSREENKNITPPSFEIVSIRDPNLLNEKGKLRVIGKFSSEIKEKMIFEIPLTFPSTKLKCTVIKAKENEEVEIICKTQKAFKNVKIFLFESRIIKRKFKEIIFIKSKSFSFINPISSENYNHIHFERIKRRQKLNIFFLQLSKFKAIERKAYFFMALAKRTQVKFQTIQLKAFIMTVKFNYLRFLKEEEIITELPIICQVSTTSYTAAGFNCSSNDAQNIPINIQLNTDDVDIAGIPDDVGPSEYPIDYSNPDNLKIVDKLPNVTITSIDASDCNKNGEYILKGKLDNGVINDAFNIEIPFGFPDSSGLCDIKVYDKDITMKCHNKEKFEDSQILFEPTAIRDNKGKDIFKLNDYTNTGSFTCDISIYSIPKKNNDIKVLNLPMRKKSSRGLSGGTIALMIISIIVTLIILGVIIWLTKRNFYSKNKAPNYIDNSITNVNDNQTIKSLKINQNN